MVEIPFFNYHNNQMSFTPEQKLKIIKYSNQHGIDTTLEAVELDCNSKLSKATLCRWRKQWKQSCDRNYGTGNLLDLTDKSKKPLNYRSPNYDTRILEFIQLTRLQHPGIGKDKIKVLLDKYCSSHNIDSISQSTIGRIISKLRQQRIIPQKVSKKVYLDGQDGQIKVRIIKPKKSKLRRKDYQPQSPGDLVQLDAITYYLNGSKRYLICAVDLVSRFSFSLAYKSLNSANTKDFLIKFRYIAPFEIKRLQTDNGQENHRYLDEYLKEQNIPHFWNYPRSPKMNAFVERFNRTIQEEFIDWNLWLLRDDVELFNLKLMNQLLFHNFERPHEGLKKDYGQFVSPMEYLSIYHGMSQMMWTGTFSCQILRMWLKLAGGYQSSFKLS